MKKDKQTRFITIIIVIIGLLLTCFLNYAVSYSVGQDKIVVGFDNSFDVKSPFYTDINNFNDYESEYSQYRVDMHYNNLTEKEKVVYHIYEYAFENSYDTIYLDNRYFKDGETNGIVEVMDYYNILIFLSLDSPLIESNVGTRYAKDIDIIHKVGFLKLPIECSVKEIKVSIFNEGNLAKKKQALTKAKEIVSACPDNFSDLERYEYYFKYIANNTDYREGTESGTYLYDCLFLKKGNCDAFSNTYSLLCNLSGIICFEKIYPENEQLEGHVWNCIELDGEYYNVDTTYQHNWKDNNYLLWFGYSDEAQKQPNVYKSILPECTDNIYLIYLEFNSVNDVDFKSKIKSALNDLSDQEKKYVLVSLEDKTDADEKLNELRTDFNVVIPTIFDNPKYQFYVIPKK